LAFLAFRLDLHAAALFERHSRWPPRDTRKRASLRVNQPESCSVLDATFVSFESPSEILSSRGPWQIQLRRSIDRSQLSVVPTSVQDSSLGVAKDPLRRTPHYLSTPASSRSKRPFPGFGDHLPKCSLVPFLSFLPTSTVYSRRCFAGLLHPAADHGVHHVSDCFLTCAGQGTAQSGPSPLAAAFAVLMSRRPPSQLVEIGRSRRNPWSATRALRLHLGRFARRRCAQYRGG
jgi:hypothetical protein